MTSISYISIWLQDFCLYFLFDIRRYFVACYRMFLLFVLKMSLWLAKWTPPIQLEGAWMAQWSKMHAYGSQLFHCLGSIPLRTDLNVKSFYFHCQMSVVFSNALWFSQPVLDITKSLNISKRILIMHKTLLIHSNTTGVRKPFVWNYVIVLVYLQFCRIIIIYYCNRNRNIP